jgi:hypothetical protein
MTIKKRCPDCGVGIGEDHKDGCDVERCPECGHQMISCGCACFFKPRLPWLGFWPGDMECREFGWYAKLDKANGWIRCDKDDPEATEDLNRLYREAKWDPDKRRFVKRKIRRIS